MSFGQWAVAVTGDSWLPEDPAGASAPASQPPAVPPSPVSCECSSARSEQMSSSSGSDDLRPCHHRAQRLSSLKLGRPYLTVKFDPGCTCKSLNCCARRSRAHKPGPGQDALLCPRSGGWAAHPRACAAGLLVEEGQGLGHARHRVRDKPLQFPLAQPKLTLLRPAAGHHPTQ